MNKKISRGSVPKNRHDERRQNMKKKERTHYENLHCPDQTQLFQTQWTVKKQYRANTKIYYPTW